MADTGRLFVLRPEDRQQGYAVSKRCAAAIREAMERLHAQGKAVDVRISAHKSKRSLAQNRCLHGWMRAISDWHDDATGQRIQPEAWKLWFVQQLIGEDAIQMPGGAIHSRIRSTTTLTVAEFKDFLDRIEAWAGQQSDLHLPRGADYYEAMGVDR